VSFHRVFYLQVNKIQIKKYHAAAGYALLTDRREMRKKVQNTPIKCAVGI
jgi:hypothetical protein